MDAKNEIPQRLKTLRELMGYSPKEFAELIGIKQQTYYVYESGRALPSIDKLIRIAETCNITLDWLCGVAKDENTTCQQNEVSSVLSQLLQANEKGKQIEVRIVCQSIGDRSRNKRL